MGNYISFLNRSSNITHVPLMQQTSIEIHNIEGDAEQERIECSNNIKNIYNWISENKTFCAIVATGTCTIGMGACIIGYLYYLNSEVKRNEEEVINMMGGLMCALDTFVKDVYNNTPNITDTEMWKNLTSRADAIMESYPPELLERVKGIMEECDTLKAENTTPNNIQSFGL